jgi:hypothetical protein
VGQNLPSIAQLSPRQHTTKYPKSAATTQASGLKVGSSGDWQEPVIPETSLVEVTVNSYGAHHCGFTQDGDIERWGNYVKSAENSEGHVVCHQRLGGRLKYYSREAARGFNPQSDS